MDHGYAASNHGDGSRLGDGSPFGSSRSETLVDERSSSVMEVLMSSSQTDMPLPITPALEGEPIDSSSTAVICETELYSPGLALTLAPDLEWFASFVSEDENRCAEYKLPSTWSTPQAIATLQILNKFPAHHRDICLRLWAGICSSSSVVNLQELMQVLKSGLDIKPLCLGMELSVQNRLQVIDRAEKCVKGLLAIRRLHALQLWRDQPQAAGGDPWINLSICSASGSTKSGQRGNPLFMQESAATRSLLERVYPDLSPSSPEYRRVYERLKKIRRLGRRLETMASRFGTGILGLLPCSDFGPHDSIPAVSDHAYAKHSMKYLYAY